VTGDFLEHGIKGAHGQSSRFSIGCVAVVVKPRRSGGLRCRNGGEAAINSRFVKTGLFKIELSHSTREAVASGVGSPNLKGLYLRIRLDANAGRRDPGTGLFPRQEDDAGPRGSPAFRELLWLAPHSAGVSALRLTSAFLLTARGFEYLFINNYWGHRYAGENDHDASDSVTHRGRSIRGCPARLCRTGATRIR
jgi:hypothetical protein